MQEFKINILVIEDGAGHINTVRDAFQDGYKEGLTFMEASIFPHEDNQEKYTESIKKYSEEFHNGSAEAENNFFEFIMEQIKQNDIDAIFLDLLLSELEENIKDTLQPHLTSGGKILELLKSSVYRNMPIVAYTKLKSKLPKNEKVGSKIIFSVNKDGFNKDRFFQQQADFYRLYKEIENFKFQKNNLCDIAIICALKKELKPVIELFKKEDIEEKTDTSVTGYLIDKKGKKRKVVALTKEQMGMAEAATFTTQMIDKYSPSFVVMTGIAAGIDDKQDFLDILMPEQIFNWQSGKFKKVKKNNKIIHLFDPDSKPSVTYISKKPDLNIDTSYLQSLPENFLCSEDFSGSFIEDSDIVDYIESIGSKNEKYKSEFQKELLGIYKKEKEKLENKIKDIKKKKDSGEKKKELQELESKKSSLNQIDLVTEFIRYFTQNLECKIQKVGMVSGSAVVADEELKSQEIEKRGIHGIDMEAYGVAYACNKHPAEPNVIILKSICDFADSTKNDIYQTAAAYVSAQAFYKLFTEVIDMD